MAILLESHERRELAMSTSYAKAQRLLLKTASELHREAFELDGPACLDPDDGSAA